MELKECAQAMRRGSFAMLKNLEVRARNEQGRMGAADCLDRREESGAASHLPVKNRLLKFVYEEMIQLANLGSGVAVHTCLRIDSGRTSCEDPKNDCLILSRPLFRLWVMLLDHVS